jgi:uncharacterized protein
MAQDDPAEQLAEVSVCLLDAGPLIAVLDRADPGHARVSRAFAAFRGMLLTTGAVVTEAMHFLADDRDGPGRLVDFLERTDTRVGDAFTRERLSKSAQLMRKYADLPMDFADATLVLMAEEAGVSEIFTLDEHGFRTYRFGRNKRFRLVLDGFR